ncbi:outer membrane beta-barrel protein [Sanguibacteroides justesenii]|uniref:Outer membrane protein beta-barrel domain-containing protein n=1 Tax=Sanguibacteroides justesenii TaxID=1547597 RepID=A0AB34R7U4_9PORP|nr:outer membrane beta-barrel protein [Sanguibacteroides justesenii]KIO43527.1 hypothetical protein IE90_10370 [Sanguibacteroides justesenii]PXZ45216.1 hypothetical protein DMB45_01965 [Sanguibacteroides justesenii]
MKAFKFVCLQLFIFSFPVTMVKAQWQGKLTTEDRVRLNSSTLIGYNMIFYEAIVVDSVTNEPLPGALIHFVNPNKANVSVRTFAVDKNGYFCVYCDKDKRWVLEITHLGYKIFKKILSQDQPLVNFGKIKLIPDTLKIDEVVVQVRREMYKQKGDTLMVYPQAFRYMEGDNLLEIFRQIPGAKVTEEGDVYIGKMKIEKGLVNGRMLFGDDVRTLMKSLDAKDASVMAIYDEVDEKDEILRGDNARKRKVVNVMTFQQFTSYLAGNMMLEGGLDKNKDIDGGRQERYCANGDIGFYREQQQIRLKGGIDNRNLIIWSPPSGYTRKWNAGAEVNSTINESNRYAVSYDYGNEYSTEESLSNINYFPTDQFQSQFSENFNYNENDEKNHRIKLEYNYLKQRKVNIDASCDIGIYKSADLSDYYSDTYRDDVLLTKTERVGHSDNNSVNISPAVSFTKNIGIGGLKVSVYSNINKSNGNEIRNDTTFTVGFKERTVLNITTKRPDWNIVPSVEYNVNFKKAGSFSFISKVKYENLSFYNVALNRITGDMDRSLSVDYTSSQTIVNEDVVYYFGNGKHSLNVNLAYTGTFMNRRDKLPVYDKVYRSFHAFLPAITYGYSFTRRTYDISLSTSQSVPSNSHMITVINDNNPMFLFAGNPDLKDSKTYIVSFTSYNRKQNIPRAISFGVDFSINHNSIVYSRMYFKNSTVLPQYDNYEAPAGATLTIPVNADDFLRTGANLSYKVRWDKIKSIVDFKLEYHYQNPQVGIEDRLVRTHEQISNFSANLVMNLSSKFRGEISNDTRYRWFENGNAQIDEGVNEVLKAKFRWDFLKRVYLTSSYTFEYLKGTYSKTVENHILNASMGCRVFKNRKGLVSFNAYNILDRTTNFVTSVNDQYVNNTWRQLSSSYFSLSFEYRFNNTK